MKFELSNKNQRNEPKHLKYEEINSGTGVLVVEWVEVEADLHTTYLALFLGPDINLQSKLVKLVFLVNDDITKFRSEL